MYVSGENEMKTQSLNVTLSPMYIGVHLCVYFCRHLSFFSSSLQIIENNVKRHGVIPLICKKKESRFAIIFLF